MMINPARTKGQEKMKPYLYLKLREGLILQEPPYWTKILQDKRHTSSSIRAEIDRILARCSLPAWITGECKPRRHAWSPEELQSELNRIYHIIHLEHKTISPNLVSEPGRRLMRADTQAFPHASAHRGHSTLLREAITYSMVGPIKSWRESVKRSASKVNK
jgi:hypothetical protein